MTQRRPLPYKRNFNNFLRWRARYREIGILDGNGCPIVGSRVSRVVTMCLLLLIGLPLGADAQTILNPRTVTFACPDHAQDTGHEVDIIDAKGVVIQTIQGGDPAADTSGNVTIDINVQPVTFGTYTVVVRATAGTIESPNSPASDVWQRSPGSPGKPSVK